MATTAARVVAGSDVCVTPRSRDRSRVDGAEGGGDGASNP
jgi:hypothetical protein